MSSNWPILKIEDVAERVGMGPFGSSIKVETFVDSGVPVISGEHLHDITLTEKKFRFITEKHAEQLAKSNVFRGDVVFTHAGTIGQVSVVPENSKYEKYIISQRQFFMRCNRELVNPLYVAYFFKSPQGRHKLLANASQVGVPSIARPVTYLRSIEIPIPSLALQNRIVKIIESIRDRITLLRETNKTLEAIAQALFKSWFVDFDPVRAKMEGRQPEGMDEATAALFPDSFEESELGLVPQGWFVKAVSDLAEIVKGKSYSSKDLVAESSVALVTLKSFERGGGFRMDGFKPYSGAYKPSQVVRAGDLIVAYTDVTQAAELIGKPAIVVTVNEYDTLVASLDVGIVRPRSNEYGRQFLYGLFKTDAFQSHTLAHTSGTTVLHLAKDGVGSYLLATPPAQVVARFESVAMTISDRMQVNADKIRTLVTLRDALLPRLISGQLRLPEAEAAIEALTA